MGTNIRTSISRQHPYYISKHEYLMVKHFALQYGDWKKQKAEIEGRIGYGFRAEDISGREFFSPVEAAAMKSERYAIRIGLIEEIAKIAGEDIWEFVLLGVTTECSYEYLRLVKNIPCCKDVYYRMYRKFYWLLARELQDIFDHQNCKLLNGNL